MKILLTGINSFVGRTLYPLLLKKNYEVIGISRNKSSELNHLVGDLAVETTYEKLPDDFDVVIHLAAVTTPPVESARVLFQNNVEATSLLVDFCKRIKVKKIIYASSLSIYGDIKAAEVNENNAIVNPSIYGISKYMGELLLKEIATEIPSFSLRLPAIVGKGATRHFLARVMDCIKQKEMITISNPHNLLNNCVHVENLSEFILHLLELDLVGFNVANIGSKDAISIEDCIKILSSNSESLMPINIVSSTKPSFLIDINQAVRYGFLPWSTETALLKWIN